MKAGKMICGFAAVLLLAAGCVRAGTKFYLSPRTGGTLSVMTPDFFGIGEDLAYQLTSNLRQGASRHERLIMATFVNIDDLDHTSRFGRVLPQSLADQLFRHGFRVVEIRKAKELLMKSRTGELVLSRDAARVADSDAADGIVCGTYALTPQTVIVNVRLLNAASQEVESVADIEIQRSKAINGLLMEGTGGNGPAVLSAYER